MATSVKPKLVNNMLQLCDLPDEILIQILSLLPLKSALATSALSRRWQFVWALVRNFKINQGMFPKQSEFINFVDRAMDHRRGFPLESFSLSCKCESPKLAACINSWITSSFQCNVKELVLNLQCTDPSYLMLGCIFGSQSLVKCVLNMEVPDTILKVPSSICLSNLKCLRLYYVCVTFLDDGLTEKKLDLPMLKEMVIKSCSWCNYKAVHISAPKLKILDIHNSHYDIVGEGKVCIFSDSIRSFSFGGIPSNEYRICGSTTQLSKAEILACWGSDMSNMGVAASHCYNLVNGLSSVQDLTLNEELLKLLQSSPELIDTIPVFQCLTRLNLHDDDNEGVVIDSQILMKIYERCPLLEHLNIMKEISHVSEGPELVPMPSCFQTHLKKIRIESYPIGEFDVDAVGILLNSASVLEKMIICFDNADEDVSTMATELVDELYRRPRASNDCELSVVWDLT